jgi:hypothetical protein
MKPQIESIETDEEGQPLKVSIKTDEGGAFVAYVACVFALQSTGQDPAQWEGEVQRGEGDTLRLVFRRKPAPPTNN